jgi:hypothetical protein
MELKNIIDHAKESFVQQDSLLRQQKPAALEALMHIFILIRLKHVFFRKIGTTTIVVEQKLTNFYEIVFYSQLTIRFG